MGSRTATRKLLMLMHRGRCFYCARLMTLDAHPVLTCTIDHILPRAQGGFDHMSNYVAACYQCNNARGTLPHELFRRYVRRFGPTTSWRMGATNYHIRRARAHMEWNNVDATVINDILKAKLEAALARRQIAG